MPKGPTLLVDTSFLGDVLCAEPMVRAAARCWPARPQDFLTSPGGAEILQGHPGIREVLVFDKRGADRGMGGLRRMARELRARGYARAICSHRSWRTAFLLRMAGIPERIGFANASGARLYTRRVPYLENGHEIERNLRLVGHTGRVRPRMFPTAEERERAAHLAPPQPFVALAPGSIWATKRWPAERYAEVLRSLAAEGLP
ncbi:MAG: glycosyltransferase family 9 protein, partial [Planctomycetota bacterium]